MKEGFGWSGALPGGTQQGHFIYHTTNYVGKSSRDSIGLASLLPTNLACQCPRGEWKMLHHTFPLTESRVRYQGLRIVQELAAMMSCDLVFGAQHVGEQRNHLWHTVCRLRNLQEHYARDCTPKKEPKAWTQKHPERNDPLFEKYARFAMGQTYYHTALQAALRAPNLAANAAGLAASGHAPPARRV